MSFGLRVALLTMSLMPLAEAVAEDASRLDTLARSLDAPGGLVVHVGAGDARRAAARGGSGRFLVHLLYADGPGAERARSGVAALGLSGRATVSVSGGVNLPFIENVVNLLIVEDGPALSPREMLRVVAPRGKVLTLRGGRWERTTKEVPATIDDWTHNLYDAGNGGVSRDMEAGPPRHLQWTGGPQWSRSHDGNSSFLAMVSAGGRVFYMMDEGSTAFLSLPSKWILTARDAFNGKILWRKPLPQPLLMHVGQIKSGFANLNHRMVAQDDVVYVTLGFNAPVSALESRTGKQVWRNRATANAEELALFDGILYCVINLSKRSRITHPFQMMEDAKRPLAATIGRKLMALDAKTGEVLWERRPPKILPLSLTAGEHGVFIHDGSAIVSLDPKSGEQRWRSEPIEFYSKLQQYSGVNVVLKGDVLLFACGSAYPHKGRGYKSEWQNTITAMDARTGKVLWRAPHRQDGIFVTPDLLVADGLVWHAPIDNGRDSGDYVGLDLATGKVVRDFKGDGRVQMPHHRCYRNRATERLIFTGWTGVNIFDVKTGKWDHNYWVRGACRYGVMPANGLLYNTPSVCTCFINAKIRGLNALAPASGDRRPPADVPDAGRLVRGPEYRTGPRLRSSRPDGAWPTYRGTNSRHGISSSPLGDSFEAGWSTSIGGRLTQAVVADGRAFVAAYDQHAVYALDVDDGEVTWRFQAGGVVNSPPTIWQGKAYFGCNDGWVYCLNVLTGGLVWRYRAAPLDRRIIACENLESLWPVHGSVLVLPDPETGKGRVYAICGRSIFLDGGLRSLVLDAESGAKIAETVMDHVDPDTGKDVQIGREWLPNLPAGLPDVLSYSGGNIFMGIQPLNLQGKREKLYVPPNPSRNLWRKGAKRLKRAENTEGVHLFSTIGFLDDSEMHRSAWMYGRDSLGGCWSYPVPTFQYPSANIMSVAGERVYGYGREFYTEGQKPTMHLFAMDKNPDLVNASELFKGKKVETRHPIFRVGNATQPKRVWSKKIGTHVRALLAARNREAGGADLLFAVGTPEVIDEYDAIDLIKKQQRTGLDVGKIYLKEKSVAGELGAMLMVVSAADGDVISETRLDRPAVFDGMSAAYGRIFIADVEGNVVCLKPAKED
ncbi:MAG: outer membrane protein assembly factor BamB family protein [Planctomycetota bacterium]